MSHGEASVDCVHPRLDRLPSKRKLDDYVLADDEDDLVSDLVVVRMRKDETDAFNSTTANQITSPSHIEPRVSDACLQASCSLSRLQFFVRMMSEGNTLVIQANSEDTVQSIHERIEAITGIPVMEQRLIYRGKQLQCEQSLAQCSIQNDAGLQLVGRMRSTHHPQAWQVINEMVSLIFRLCKGEVLQSAKFLKARLMEFLTMTPRTDCESAAGHLQIFLSSCAPAALVMLYISPHQGNKDCAEDLIRLFVNSSRNMLPKSIHSLCAPIVLEFCKLLGRAAQDDPLYSLCRSNLGSMMESFGNGRGLINNENRSLIVVQDIFPFVIELAARLSTDLVSSMESSTTGGPSSSDVRDFTAFLHPIRTAIIDLASLACAQCSIPMLFVDGGYKHPRYAEEVMLLHGIFTDLLEKMEQCLQKMEEFLALSEKQEEDHLVIRCCQYLAILKELHSIAALYQGAEEQFWTKLRCRKVSICFLIIKYAKRSEDHKWLLEHKDVTDFEARRHLVMMMLPDMKDEYDELHEMLIDRSQLLAESFEYIAHADPSALKNGLFMEFKNEEATGPGVLREWFFLVCQAIFDPQNALFSACPNDRRRFYPNPASKVDPLHLEYFTFSGRVIALALMHKVQVGIVFDRVFFLQLAGKHVALEDIRDADPDVYDSWKKILEMNAEDVDSGLGLTFEEEVEELGSRKIVELCPGGKSIAVNSRNREEYVDYLVQYRFVTSITEQVAHFAKGFADILCKSNLQKFFFQSLALEDLDWMLHGSESAISVEDWKAHTEYNGYKESDSQIQWFWKIVEGMSKEQRKVLLFFWTSIKYLPVEGFRGLASRLYIYKTLETHDRLPSSHTCFNRLCFPPYPSMTIMQDRLGIITQEHVGCSFGTW